CEVIERDATTLWHLLPAAAQAETRVDLDTVDDPGCRGLLERYAAAGVDVAVWESTSDVGVPAFMCLITEAEAGAGPALHSAGGMGCHPARAVALARALTEAAQSRLTVISGSRDDIFRHDFDASRSPENLRRDREVIRGETGGRDFADGPGRVLDDIDGDLTWILGRLRAVGIEQVICFDLTRPEFNIPVARVLVPGLEGLATAAGYAPGPRAHARARQEAS
ncbi:MAG: YcaO-like family protein, partial [Myxococcales bacterium]|nr:YcaO-like family protein [Myxococcales bacterium]